LFFYDVQRRNPADGEGRSKKAMMKDGSGLAGMKHDYSHNPNVQGDFCAIMIWGDGIRGAEDYCPVFLDGDTSDRRI